MRKSPLKSFTDVRAIGLPMTKLTRSCLAATATKKRKAPTDKAEPPKKRGRPSSTVKKDEKDGAPKAKAATGKPRGRPKKSAPAVSETDLGPLPRKRGSGPKGGETTKITADDDAAADQLEEELVDTAEAEDDEGAADEKRKRNLPFDGEHSSNAKKSNSAIADAALEAGEDGGKQYWLMKAEQEVCNTDKV